MKTKSIIQLTIIVILLSSCAPRYFYQVYKAKPTQNLIVNEDFLIYEDNNCSVSYNFWGRGGLMGFSFYNKTDNNIYLNLEECYFIVNDVAYDYYLDRNFTYSKASGVTATNGAGASTSVTGVNSNYLLQTNQLSASSTVGAMIASGYAVTYTEDKIICIPAKTSKIVTEYKINNTLLRSCDLYKYPSKKNIQTISYEEDSSPLIFSNRLAYSIGESKELIKFENEFYISEITNYPESEIIESKMEEYCGQKGSLKKYFKDVSSDKFYIKYKKGMDPWKH